MRKREKEKEKESWNSEPVPSKSEPSLMDVVCQEVERGWPNSGSDDIPE